MGNGHNLHPNPRRLVVVVDLFSRKVIGWSMQPRMTKDIVLNALLMAVWRRTSQKQVLVHSEQGSQYTVVPEITRSGEQYEPSW